MEKNSNILQRITEDFVKERLVLQLLRTQLVGSAATARYSCYQEMMRMSSSLTSRKTLFLPLLAPCLLRMTDRTEL
jgi:hypothetical protein